MMQMRHIKWEDLYIFLLYNFEYYIYKLPYFRTTGHSSFAVCLTLPSAALGKAFFAECPTKGTRQRIQHSAKPAIPVVSSSFIRRGENFSSFRATPIVL
jgi:hypothetical protein